MAAPATKIPTPTRSIGVSAIVDTIVPNCLTIKSTPVCKLESAFVTASPKKNYPLSQLDGEQDQLPHQLQIHQHLQEE